MIEKTVAEEADRFGRFGPGMVITAAFIGPGTVITCASSGASFGTALLWALLVAGITTIVLQEMSVRLGLATGRDLAENLGGIEGPGWARYVLPVLASAAILIGCAAYQAGNLIGGASGLAVLAGGDLRLWVLLQGAVAAFFLWTGRYRWIERFLVLLVAVMSLSFIGSAFFFAPAIAELIGGMLIPALPADSLLTVTALIGTTVVPYNLFLHSRIVREKWGGAIASQRAGAGSGEVQAGVSTDLAEKKKVIRWARADLILAVGIGIAASMAITVTAAGALQGAAISDVGSFAEPLRRLMGAAGAAVFGIGLWAAGMTSALTAPLAAAYTVAGAFSWPRDRRYPPTRFVWMLVLASGLFFALTSSNAIILIIAAQALNGIILPVAAVFLLVELNRRKVGPLANSLPANVVAIIVILVVTLLAGRYLLRAFGVPV